MYHYVAKMVTIEGQEVSSVSHSTFWLIWMHCPGTHSTLHFARIDCFYNILSPPAEPPSSARLSLFLSSLQLVVLSVHTGTNKYGWPSYSKASCTLSRSAKHSAMMLNTKLHFLYSNNKLCYRPATSHFTSTEISEWDFNIISCSSTLHTTAVNEATASSYELRVLPSISLLSQFDVNHV